MPPAARRSLITILSGLIVVSLSLNACSHRSPVPPWFDGIHRYPITTVNVNGNTIAYTDQGNGPPVILIHGFIGSMWQWEYQQELRAAHRVITLDYLGAGLSDKPDIPYTPRQLVDFLRDFMDQLGISRASLVGSSMGAGIAIGMALSYPARVDRLVLISGLPSGVRDKVISPIVKKAIENRLPLWLINLGNQLGGRNVTRRGLSEMVYDETLLTPLVIDRSHRNRKRAGVLRSALTMVKQLPVWERDFAPRLREIRHPTLVVWGDKDEVFPAEVGEELARLIPGAVFRLIHRTGHLPMWERPDLVNGELTAFLRVDTDQAGMPP